MNHKIHLSKNKSRDYVFNNLSEISKNISDFELSLETYLNNGAKVACFNSGTSALHLALILANVGEGDLVLCQSFTYVATINPVLYQYATPVFIDSENETWNMCPKKLEVAIKDQIFIGKKPKAIIVVHTYGMPCQIDEISSLAKKYDIKLIEDAAEAIGSEYKGGKCGTFGDFGILSFNNNKIITTFGGGALICKTEEDKNRAIFFAKQAKDKAAHYQHSEIGYNYRMSHFLAQIGTQELKHLNEQIIFRRNMNLFYEELFKENLGVKVFKEINLNTFSNHWLSCVLIDEKVAGFSREELRLSLLNDNIECRFLWKPMHLQPVFKDYPYYGDKVAERLFEKGLCLPSGSNLNNDDLKRITSSINKLL